MSVRCRLGFPVLLSALCASAPSLAQTPAFLEFESGPVRPLVLSADGARLYACNIPDNRLEIYDVSSTGLLLRASVPVGMEPVSVALRTPNEAWVVNHLSDSVSVVDLAASPPVVKRTLLVGDEPRDIVFAQNGRAFITTAHRGEQRVDPSLAGVPGAGDPQLTSEGVGRADVWVFDGANPGAGFGGTPLAIKTFFGDTPRALAVNGNTVYAAVFYSGNRTSIATHRVVCDGIVDQPCGGDGVVVPGGLPLGQMPGGLPQPRANRPFNPATDPPNSQLLFNSAAPETSLIVQFKNGIWADAKGRNWTNAIRWSLPDQDVFTINALDLNAPPTVWTGVGTTLFNMAVNPASGKVYVSNTDAQNLTRFEGPGQHGGSTVQGNLAQSRITILESGRAVPRHLNSHINYGIRPAPAGTANHSLATPLGMVFSPNGSTVYVAAYGSKKVGVIPTAALEGGTFNPAQASAGYITLTGGGPAGLALSPGGDRLYVLTRFDNAIAVIDTSTRAELRKVRMHNPEPPTVVEGRPFLYDATLTSSNGETACASCHIFGDTDHMGWDLGNPDAPVSANPSLINLGLVSAIIGSVNGGAGNQQLHPMKGPMVTQPLKGLANHGHMHWRGDRVDGPFSPKDFLGNVMLGARNTWEHTSFMNFIDAFSGLNGRAANIADGDMEKFTQFALQIRLPPNAIRPLNNDNNSTHRQLATRYDPFTGQPSTLPNAVPASPFLGREFFFGRAPGEPSGQLSDGVPGLGFTCDGCHTLQPQNGFFGGNGTASFEGLPQIFKIPQVRGMYQKVGLFGRAGQGEGHTGDQVRGFGFEHDGSIDTLFHFFQSAVFNIRTNFMRIRHVESFMMAMEGDLAPIVGQQITLTNTNAASVNPRIDLMIQRAGAPFVSQILGGNVTECDLIAKTVIDGKPRGFVRRSDGRFYSDVGGSALSDQQVRGLASNAASPVTFTCAPPGSGQRMGIDRDLDTVLDGVDNCPGAANQNQADADGDGIGDVCEGTTSGGGDEGCGPSGPATSIPLALVGLLSGLGGLGFWRRRRGVSKR